MRSKLFFLIFLGVYCEIGVSGPTLQNLFLLRNADNANKVNVAVQAAREDFARRSPFRLERDAAYFVEFLKLLNATSERLSPSFDQPIALDFVPLYAMTKEAFRIHFFEPQELLTDPGGDDHPGRATQEQKDDAEKELLILNSLLASLANEEQYLDLLAWAMNNCNLDDKKSKSLIVQRGRLLCETKFSWTAPLLLARAAEKFTGKKSGLRIVDFLRAYGTHLADTPSQLDKRVGAEANQLAYLPLCKLERDMYYPDTIHLFVNEEPPRYESAMEEYANSQRQLLARQWKNLRSLRRRASTWFAYFGKPVVHACLYAITVGQWAPKYP